MVSLIVTLLFAAISSSIMIVKSSVQALSSTQRLATDRQFRIFCFGDSLTAGTSPPQYEDFPYASYLEASLNQQKALFPAGVKVRHMGYPGWTASQLLSSANDARGLRTLVRRVQDPPLSIVILLAGTNDLSYLTPPEEILQSVISLHEICFEEQVPRSIAISIPPSQYQSVSGRAAETADAVNQGLKSYCDNSHGRSSSFVSFPFDWARGDDLWCDDGLHLTQKGYQELAETLSSVIQESISKELH